MIEIEKKYRLSEPEINRLVSLLAASPAVYHGEEFEENTLFAGSGLDPARQVLRLRRIGSRAILTFKERYPSDSAIKHQREDETAVDDADALLQILNGLGYQPSLVYEKKRRTWTLSGAEVVLDQLPFGWYAEIEGDESSILAAEAKLNLQDAESEELTYPQLTEKFGKREGETISSRFS